MRGSGTRRRMATRGIDNASSVTQFQFQLHSSSFSSSSSSVTQIIMMTGDHDAGRPVGVRPVHLVIEFALHHLFGRLQNPRHPSSMFMYCFEAVIPDPGVGAGLPFLSHTAAHCNMTHCNFSMGLCAQGRCSKYKMVLSCLYPAE